jgi:hypothetical protein
MAEVNKKREGAEVFNVVRLFLVTNILLLAACCLGQGAPSLEEFRQATKNFNMWADSPFIFKGTVIDPKGGEFKELLGEPGLVTIRVNHIYHASSPDSSSLGKNITLRLRPHEVLRQHERYVFFTRGWLYGESIAVVEVGKMNTFLWKSFVFFQKVKDFYDNLEKNTLWAKYKSADVVVIGTVRGKASPLPTSGFSGEHDSLPAVIVVEVAKYLKGTPGGRYLKVAFARSRDELYWNSPKLSDGVGGVFFLRKGGLEYPSDVLTLLNSGDHLIGEQQALLLRLVHLKG